MTSGLKPDEERGFTHRLLRSATMRLAAIVFLALAAIGPATAGCDDDDRPATPISLKATPLSSGGIMLQWSSRAGHYDIYITDKQGRPVPEAPNITGGATNENYHEFYGLQPDKEYFFSMRARSEGGTEGCVSKNASETVSAKTDTAEMNQHCKYYAQTAMEDVQTMQKLGCELPDSSITGRWATREGTQFNYCMGQQRAGRLGDANYSWLRNQDIQACKEKKHREKCTAYSKAASNSAIINRIRGCGYTGARWGFSKAAHYDWCMGLAADSFLPFREARTRAALLNICRKRQASTGGGGGTGAQCAGVPSDWASMLKAHNDLRGQYCGAPLTWSCDLAAQAQAYADKCILNEHGASGENMADMWSSDDKYPAGTDEAAFEAVWGCERTEFHFDAPEIVGGFKEDCHKGKDGQKPVNGHFTQIVWRANKVLGCGRANCPMTDKDGKVHQGTHWVCRFLPGGNGNQDGGLAENVKQPPCGNAFHSLTVPSASCLRGMVQTASGQCQCPPGQSWNGRTCSAVRINATPVAPPPGSPAATAPPALPPVIACPSDRPVGTPPNCCPDGTRFEDGVCRRPTGGGGSNGTRRGGAASCPRSRPIGTPPNCCPEGTSFSNGSCRRGSGGSNGTQPGGAASCPRSRPVGTPPNCCPTGTIFSDGKCRTGNGGSNAAKPGNSSSCPANRPVGTPPNCCPTGTIFSDGKCRTGNGGSNTTKPGNSSSCPANRPVGTPPNCCPTGTTYNNGSCVRPTPPTTPGSSTTQPNSSSGSCTGGRIGRPPHCRCPAGTRAYAGRCMRIPTPQKTCPSGLTGPNCDQVIVR